MSDNGGSKDPIRDTLKRLINESNASFSADDVLREFRGIKDKPTSRHLSKILEILSKNQPQAAENLAEISKLLHRKDPFFCLIKFLENYTDFEERSEMMPRMFHTDMPTSTPLSRRLDTGDLKPEHVLDNTAQIKERVVQAAASSTSQLSRSSFMNVSNTVAALATCQGPEMNNISPPSSAKSGSSTSEFPPGKRTDALWDFHKVDNSMHTPMSEIAAIPLKSQETLLVYDLIYSLSGVRGTYIKPKDSQDCDELGFANHNNNYCVSFEISPQIQKSLSDIAAEIVPLASHYSCIQRLIQKTQEPEAGQVLQALGSSLNDLTCDYYLLLAQLETELFSEKLSLQKMLFYLRPSLNTKEMIASAAADIMMNDCRGAAALTLLSDKINSLTGDDDSQDFMIKITRAAAVPYMKTLQMWIQKGVIDDSTNEFLVEDNEVIRREELPEHYSADYWEKRYTIRRERVPCFLEKVSDMILRTGKYLNVIRQCGKNMKPPQPMNLEYIPTSQEHIKTIQSAYHFASKNLLEVLLKENDLMGHLMSVKRYLLLNQGDFIMQFMDACEEELSKNVDQVLPMALENLLGLTLRLSSARNDPYKDELHCQLLTYDLVTQMSKIMNNEEELWQSLDRLDLNGLECFAFRYDVKWPISLVLNHIAISKYQMLFRQLFYCKHVERQLCKIWKENAKAKKFAPKAAELYRSAFTLRQRMMNAIQNLEYYMMIEVIEPNWHTFIQKMEKVGNVDDVLTLHQDFLDSCLKNCMLTDTTTLNRAIFKMCNICLKFCEFIQSETSMEPTETFSERVKCFDTEFTNVLIVFLKLINDIAAENPSDRFMNLVHRINFNSFYNELMEKPTAKDAIKP